ncbi:MAG: class I SAM-dependent methyltransferase [Oscillatoriales cyanobacterium SM2_3_0]|nr:class I SAM-dependent methyltransferase [Oscillatoriales cyanobacterium SM2_3_0]
MALSWVILSFWLGACTPSLSASIIDTDGIYETRPIHHPDGIGKFYMGREIAQVMGYEGGQVAGAIQSGCRTTPAGDRALGLKPTDTVADIGAGTGYFTFRISPLVPEGKVLAVDIQPEMLDLIDFVKQQEQISNVETILGTVDTPNLPTDSIDLALMVDAYHEFTNPREMMEHLMDALRVGGRVVLVEYRGENPLIPIKGLHKMTEKQVQKEMEAVGFTWKETSSILPQQHLMIFEK